MTFSVRAGVFCVFVRARACVLACMRACARGRLRVRGVRAGGGRGAGGRGGGGFCVSSLLCACVHVRLRVRVCACVWGSKGKTFEGCSEERSAGKPWCKVRAPGRGGGDNTGGSERSNLIRFFIRLRGSRGARCAPGGGGNSTSNGTE